jgi:Zn finger protein HypA/HybF involved in hydrogenase expression
VADTVPPGAAPPAATDPDVSARDKFTCPACGGEAHWNPDKQALICPFCGTESPATLEVRGAETVILEHDLVSALRGLPDSSRGWQAEKTSVKCQSCQAISVFDADKISRRCDFCGSTALVPYEQVKDAFRPESLLPLAISEPKSRDLIRAWYRNQWLAPNAFKSKALPIPSRRLPAYWTFDAQVDARWTASGSTGSGNKQVRKVMDACPATARSTTTWCVRRSAWILHA